MIFSQFISQKNDDRQDPLESISNYKVHFRIRRPKPDSQLRSFAASQLRSFAASAAIRIHEQPNVFVLGQQQRLPLGVPKRE
jgi:hypothetical protein